MDMNTMNLVNTIAMQTNLTTSRTADLTTLTSTELETWFGDAGLAVTEVSHCATADCPVCFPFEAAKNVTAGPLNMGPLAA